MTVEQLRAEIAARRVRADRGCRAWSTAFHLSFGIPTITGVVIAALSGKGDTFLGARIADYIPLIALIGSICSAVGVFGGFERKWRANRITRNELDILLLKLDAGDDRPKEVDELIDILRAHDAGILQDRPKSDTLTVGRAHSKGTLFPMNDASSHGRLSSHDAVSR